MLTTARTLLFVAALHALLAGVLWSPIPTTFLLIIACGFGLLAWSAYLAHRKAKRLPSALLTDWRAGRAGP